MDGVEYLGAGGDLNSYNLYSYCNNNPVMYADPSGNSFLAISLILLSTTIIGGVIGGVVSYEMNKDSEERKVKAKDVILGASLGLAAGGALISVAAVITGAVSCFGGSAAFLGVTAQQGFALGALAFNFTAFFVAPLYGITMEGIEYESPSPLPIPIINR